MSLKHSILAVLTLGDCHGYQIRQEIESRTGQTYDINIGQIYSTLERLQRDGYVTANKQNSEGQITYSITVSGKSEANDWLNAPVLQSTPVKNELAIKLALAVTIPGVNTERILQLQRISALQNLQTLTTAKMATNPLDSTDLAWQLILDSQIFSLESELRWLDHVEGVLTASAARGLNPQNALSANLARRGRPIKNERSN